MMWKPDPRSLKPFGPYEVVSEVNRDRETAHLVTFPDGRRIRVLPSGTSGQYRARTVAVALDSLQRVTEALGGDLGHLDASVYFCGAMADAGLDVQRVTVESWESFLGEFLDVETVAVLVEAMTGAGWKAERT